jgi:catechol 2,3-dioxygenase-like lactoylglutathione lyase family enzyme
MDNIRRVVPEIKSTRMNESRAFYVDFLGLKVGMDMGFVMTFISPSNPTAQISVVRDDGASMPQPNVSVEVRDVDEVHARAIRQRHEIVYPLTDEPWGVHRFFVVDPNETVLNILSHTPSSGVEKISKPTTARRQSWPRTDASRSLTGSVQQPNIEVEQASSFLLFQIL